jgi:hypothetical protein
LVRLLRAQGLPGPMASANASPSIDADGSIEEMVAQMEHLAQALRERGFRTAVLGDGKVVPVKTEEGSARPSPRSADGLVSCIESDCVLVVPPGPRYIVASSGQRRSYSSPRTGCPVARE